MAVCHMFFISTLIAWNLSNAKPETQSSLGCSPASIRVFWPKPALKIPLASRPNQNGGDLGGWAHDGTHDGQSAVACSWAYSTNVRSSKAAWVRIMNRVASRNTCVDGLV